jgi:hypothetical protein
MLKNILMKLCDGYSSLDSFDIIKLAFPSVLSAILSALLSGYIITRWRSRKDLVDKRIDDLCREIDALGELAREFWSRNFKAADQSTIVNIKSKLLRISRLRVLLEGLVSNSSKNELVESEQMFLREISGGEFESPRRKLDFVKSYAVLEAGSNYVLAIRQAHLSDQKGLWMRK